MNAENNTANDSERSTVEELLPWHAAGTLSCREAQTVEEALASDPELARRYALVREELAQTVELNETLGAPSARALDALFAKIDAEPARQRAASFNLGARVREFFAGLSPRMLAWSAAAAALAIVLQAAVIGGIVIKENSAGGYETASSHRGAEDGSYVSVQPMILPLFGAWSELDLFAKLAGLPKPVPVLAASPSRSMSILGSMGSALEGGALGLRRS